MLFGYRDVAFGRDFVELIPRVTGDSCFWCWCWTPVGAGGGLCVFSVHPENTLIWCGNSTREMNNDLFDQLFDLMDCFSLLCDEGKSDVWSYGDSRRVFSQNWLRHCLSGAGLLEVTGFDVFDIRLFRTDDLVRFDTESVVSDVTGDGDGIPMIMDA